LPVTITGGPTSQLVQPLGWTFGAAAMPLVQAAAPVWGAAIAVDLTAAQLLIITATSNVAFTVAAPTGLGPAGSLYVYVLRNTSGGALGTATYNAFYHFAAAFTNPGNGSQRAALLRYDGTALYEIARTAADVAN
jgi:hypothetical protein